MWRQAKSIPIAAYLLCNLSRVLNQDRLFFSALYIQFLRQAIHPVLYSLLWKIISNSNISIQCKHSACFYWCLLGTKQFKLCKPFFSFLKTIFGLLTNHYWWAAGLWRSWPWVLQEASLIFLNKSCQHKSDQVLKQCPPVSRSCYAL